MGVPQLGAAIIALGMALVLAVLTRHGRVCVLSGATPQARSGRDIRTSRHRQRRIAVSTTCGALSYAIWPMVVAPRHRIVNSNEPGITRKGRAHATFPCVT